MTMPLLTTTLPTIIGMGVVSEATTTMFGKGRGRGRRVSGRRATVATVGVANTKANADSYATKYRKALQKKGIPYIGRVKVKKVSGGYAITYRG